MNLFKKLLLVLFVLNPFVGYLTFNLFNLPPAVFFLPLILIIVFFICIQNDKVIFPTYLLLLLGFVFYEVLTKYIVNGVVLALDVHLRESLLFVLTFFSLFIFENVEFRKGFLNKIFNALKVVIFIALIVSIIQIFIPNFFFNIDQFEHRFYLDPSNPERRIISIFSWLDQGGSMVFTLPLILNVLLGWTYHREGKINKSIWVIIAVGLICIISKSRNFLMLFTIVTLYHFHKTITIKQFIYLVLSFVIGLFILLYLQYDFDAYLFERLTSESYKTRIIALFAFAELFPKNYLFGTGGIVSNSLVDFFGYETRIHNGYLGFLYYYGLVGGIFYFSFLILFFKRLLKLDKKNYLSVAFIALLCLALGNLAVDYFYLFNFGLFATLIVVKYLDKINNNDFYNNNW